KIASDRQASQKAQDIQAAQTLLFANNSRITGDFAQQSAGDCYLLSALESTDLSGNTAVQDLIKQDFTIRSNGSIMVNFQPTDAPGSQNKAKQETVTAADLQNFARNHYLSQARSGVNLGLNALEVAYAKLRKETNPAFRNSSVLQSLDAGVGGYVLHDLTGKQ